VLKLIRRMIYGYGFYRKSAFRPSVKSKGNEASLCKSPDIQH